MAWAQAIGEQAEIQNAANRFPAISLYFRGDRDID
jgi:hypothetical protein